MGPDRSRESSKGAGARKLSQRLGGCNRASPTVRWRTADKQEEPPV
jgi:hypothetical protein